MRLGQGCMHAHARVRLCHVVAAAPVAPRQCSGLPWLAPTPWLWALMLPAGAGGAVILTLPIAYLQDLMADRPGTGSSLMSLQFLIASALGALCFAVGTALSGYGLAALLGVAVSLGGAMTLVWADRQS